MSFAMKPSGGARRMSKGETLLWSIVWFVWFLCVMFFIGYHARRVWASNRNMVKWWIEHRVHLSYDLPGASVDSHAVDRIMGVWWWWPVWRDPKKEIHYPPRDDEERGRLPADDIYMDALNCPPPHWIPFQTPHAAGFTQCFVKERVGTIVMRAGATPNNQLDRLIINGQVMTYAQYWQLLTVQENA